MEIQRNVSAEAQKELGNQIIYQLWKCYNNYKEIYGKPSEESDFTQYIDVSSKKNKVFLRFIREPNNQLYTFDCVKNLSIRVAIISIEEIETLMTLEEAEVFIRTFQTA